MNTRLLRQIEALTKASGNPTTTSHAIWTGLPISDTSSLTDVLNEIELLADDGLITYSDVLERGRYIAGIALTAKGKEVIAK